MVATIYAIYKLITFGGRIERNIIQFYSLINYEGERHDVFFYWYLIILENKFQNIFQFDNSHDLLITLFLTKVLIMCLKVTIVPQ